MRPRGRGPKAVSWSHQELGIYDNTTQYCVKLTERQIASLLTVVNEQMAWETRWFDRSPGVQSAYQIASELSYRLMTYDRCEDTPLPAPALGGGIVYIENEEEETMPAPLSIEYRDGTPYLELDCGCGEKKYFLMTEVQAAPGGGPLSTNDGGTTFAGSPLATGNESCFTSEFVKYLINRFVQYVDFWYDAALFGMNPVLGTFQSVIEYDGLVNDFLNAAGGLPLWFVDFTRDVVISDITSASVVSQLESGWAYTGPVTKQDIVSWVGTSWPLIGPGGAALNTQGLQWAALLRMSAVNDDLQQIAGDCNGGGGQLEIELPAVEYRIVQQGVYTIAYFADALETRRAKNEWDINLPEGLSWDNLAALKMIRNRTSGVGVGGGYVKEAGTTVSTSDVATSGVFVDTFKLGPSAAMAAIDNTGLLADDGEIRNDTSPIDLSGATQTQITTGGTAGGIGLTDVDVSFGPYALAFTTV